MKKTLYEISNENFNKLVSTSISFAEILRRCGLGYNGGNLGHVKKRILENGIDMSHIPIGRRHNLGREYPRISEEKVLNEFCLENSKYSRGHLKKLLIRFELIPYKCESCGIESEWNGKPISLQIDHKNGINNDNRLENLRFMCPNCHSQTPTFSGRNCKKKEKVYKKCNTCGVNLNYNKTSNCIKCFAFLRRKSTRPPEEILREKIKTQSFVSIGKEYKVSDNAIRKWCKAYGIIT